MFMEPMWHDWNDYDFGAIFGVKIKDNLGCLQRVDIFIIGKDQHTT